MKKLQIKINCCIDFPSKISIPGVKKIIERSTKRKVKNIRNSFQRNDLKLSLSILVRVRTSIEKRTKNKLKHWNSTNCQWSILGLK